MNTNGSVLLLPSPTISTVDWHLLLAEHRMIRIPTFSILTAALDAGVKDLQEDIDSVIFDRSVSSDTFLEFLAMLPQEFRGDVLFIRDRSRVFLSSSTPRDGRILYTMSTADLPFYLQARFEIRVVVDARPVKPVEEVIAQLAS